MSLVERMKEAGILPTPEIRSANPELQPPPTFRADVQLMSGVSQGSYSSSLVNNTIMPLKTHSVQKRTPVNKLFKHDVRYSIPTTT